MPTPKPEVQALKIAGFLGEFTKDINDELTILITGLSKLREDKHVQASEMSRFTVDGMYEAACRTAYANEQAGFYAASFRAKGKSKKKESK